MFDFYLFDTHPFFVVLWLFCLLLWILEIFYYVCLLFLLLPRKSYNLLCLPFSGNGRSKGSGRGRTIKEHIITKRFHRGMGKWVIFFKIKVYQSTNRQWEISHSRLVWEETMSEEKKKTLTKLFILSFNYMGWCTLEYYDQLENYSPLYDVNV